MSTFAFRVELQRDLEPLQALLRWAVEKWWNSPMSPWWDADAKMTLKPNTLTLEEVWWLFDQMADAHVAAERWP